MAKNYVTFGQAHTHSISGKTLDKDTVAVYESETWEEGRAHAFKLFDTKFSMHYFGKQWDESDLEWFPKGYIEL